jgi:hypothetical protein
MRKKQLKDAEEEMSSIYGSEVIGRARPIPEESSSIVHHPSCTWPLSTSVIRRSGCPECGAQVSNS